jgi:hypothetical protein
MSAAAPPLGRCTWAFAAPPIPARGTGTEPAFTSHDQFGILNMSDELANVRLKVFYAGHPPVRGFRIGVAPRRVRSLRVNDLIFPEAIRLEEAYALLWRSDRPVVVQVVRMDTRAARLAGMMTRAWPA